MVVANAVTFVLAFVGGLLIGIASTTNLLLKGRVTGMSGTFFGILSPDSAFIWKSCILSGLLFTSCIAFHIYGFNPVSNTGYVFDPPQVFAIGGDALTMVVAGLFVGVGTKLGNGCTSGHGVCGLPRFSPRSIAAVVTFMITSLATANFKYYVITMPQPSLEIQDNPEVMVNVALGVSILILLINYLTNKNGKQGVTDIIVSFIVGGIFSLGLIVSGMSKKSKVLGFLTFNENWDASLLFVLGGAVMLNLITFRYIIRRERPVLAEKFSIPAPGKVDLKLLMGAALFGIGWGIAGICPGPAIVMVPVYFSAIAQFMVGMGIGLYLANFTDGYFEKIGAPKGASKIPLSPEATVSPDVSAFHSHNQHL